MKKRMIAIALSMGMFLYAMPSVIFAQTTYEIWIQGIQVTSDNAHDVLGDADEGATVIYNAASNTLTLNGADLNTNNTEFKAIFTKQDLTIQLKGQNKLADMEGATAPLYSANGDLTIQGQGSLDVTSKLNFIITNGLLTIDGAKLTSQSPQDVIGGGISSAKGIIIKNNADINITGGNALFSENGVGSLTVSDSNLTLKGGNTWAIEVAKDIKITNSNLSVEGNGVAMGSGDGNIVISGGTVKAISTHPEANGLYTKNGSITIKDAKVIAAGGYPAIYGANGIAIENSDVEATSDNDVALYSPSKINISNSVMKAKSADNMAGIKASAWVSSISSSWIESSNSVGGFGTINDSVIIEGNDAILYGEFTIPKDLTVPEMTNLIIPVNAKLIIPENKILTNNGSITNKGAIVLNGDLVGTRIVSEEDGIVIHTIHKWSEEWDSDEEHHWHNCVKENCDADQEAKAGYGAHNYGDWVVVKQATENEKGIRERICTECGHTIREDIPMLTHTEETNTDTNTSKDAPLTYDNSNAQIWFYLLLIAFSAIAFCSYREKKMNH